VRLSFGDSKGRGTNAEELGEKRIELDRWYHFRVQWKAVPDKDGRCCVLMSDRKLPKDLDEDDALFRYSGPIGYTLASRPGGIGDGPSGHGRQTIREQQGIYQGPHLDPNTHHGYCIDNVAVYQRAPLPE
jgi:hypothetical protein